MHGLKDSVDSLVQFCAALVIASAEYCGTQLLRDGCGSRLRVSGDTSCSPARDGRFLLKIECL